MMSINVTSQSATTICHQEAQEVVRALSAKRSQSTTQGPCISQWVKSFGIKSPDMVMWMRSGQWYQTCLGKGTLHQRWVIYRALCKECYWSVFNLEIVKPLWYALFSLIVIIVHGFLSDTWFKVLVSNESFLVHVILQIAQWSCFRLCNRSALLLLNSRYKYKVLLQVKGIPSFVRIRDTNIKIILKLWERAACG